MIRKALRLPALVLLICVTLCLATCISAQQRDFIKYDPAKDEFQMLSVLQDIKVKEQADLDYLEAIYKNRDHLITPVLPGGAGIYPLLAFSMVRMSDNQFSMLNIYGSRPTKLENTDTKIPLDSIKVTAGTFFLQNKQLGYYQAITVPGKTIDAALLEISNAVPMDDAIKGIQAELDRRAGGGKVSTWDQLKAQALKTVTLDEPPAPDANAPAKDPDINPIMVLDAASLNNLKQAFSDKALRLKRDKQSILLSLPLAAADSAQAADLVKQVSKRVDEVVASGKDLPKDQTKKLEKLQQMKSAQAVGKAFAATPDANGITFSLDLLLSAQAIDSLPLHRADLNNTENAPGGAPAPDAPAPPDPVAFVRDHKLPLDENLTAEQIIKDFNAGTLKAYPSDKPVKPGEGIPAPEAGPPPAPMPQP